MIDPAGRLYRATTTDRAVSAASRSQVSQSQSFAAELSDRLTNTLKSGSQTAKLPASLPAGQDRVTWRDPIVPKSGSTPPPSGLNGLVITYPTTASGSSSTASGTESSAKPLSFDEAYWAKQPAPVQQLQSIQDPTQRAAAAEQLAQAGYSIDVPIMVWGWDPATTTAARESMGYTWVPSAQQQPVEVAPGVTYAGAAYDPSHPPAGSISV